jgi:hypothetical protein
MPPRPFIAACIAVAAALGVAQSAAADGTDPAYPGSVLHVSIGRPRLAGRPITIHATGHNAPDNLDVHLGYGLDVVLVDPRRLPGPCKRAFEAEVTDITNNPGDGALLTFEDLNEGSFGPFNIPVRFTTRGHGPLLVCAYSRYVTDDAAYASTRVTVYKPSKKRRR